MAAQPIRARHVGLATNQRVSPASQVVRLGAVHWHSAAQRRTPREAPLSPRPDGATSAARVAFKCKTFKSAVNGPGRASVAPAAPRRDMSASAAWRRVARVCVLCGRIVAARFRTN